MLDSIDILMSVNQIFKIQKKTKTIDPRKKIKKKLFPVEIVFRENFILYLLFFLEMIILLILNQWSILIRT